MAHSLEIKERNKGSAAKENATDPIRFLLYLLYSFHFIVNRVHFNPFCQTLRV